MTILVSTIFILCPPLLLLIIPLMRKNYGNWRKYYWMYPMLMALLAFSYAPKPNSGDLVRYLSRIDIYSQFSLKGVLARFYYREVGETIWIWVAAKLGLPGIMPGIAAGTVYGVSTYIACDYAERNDKKFLINWIIATQFLLLPFNSIVNNIFNVTAFALVLLGVYRDLVQKKRNLWTLLLYVIPCFIQQTAFVLILVRILAVPVKKLKYVAIAIVALMPGAVNLLYANRGLFGGSSFLLGIIERANYYLNETTDSEYAIRVQTVLWHRLNYVLSMLFAVIVIWGVVMLWKAKREEHILIDKRENTFLSFLFLVAILAISCVAFSAPHYWRFNLVTQMGIGFIIVLLMNEGIKSELWRYALLAVGVGNFLIQFYRIMRSAVYIGQWMQNFLLSTPFQIIYRLLRLIFSS